MSRVPRRALTHEEVTRFAKKVLEIPHFRGVFTRDALPKTSRKRECGVVNLDDARGAGTHFVAYAKRGRTVRYFDSFGLPPPPEFLRYARGTHVTYNTRQIQKYNTNNCGKLCLQFLFHEWKEDNKNKKGR